MQRIKTSLILMLRIKPVAKLKFSREKPAIRYSSDFSIRVYVNFSVSCLVTVLLECIY